MSGYIYLRTNEFYDIYDVYKLGRTKNLFNRNNTYITNEPKKGCFIYVIKILNTNKYDDIKIETYLKNQLKKYNYKYIGDGSGGTEFFSKIILSKNKILKYLNKTNINYEIYQNSDIQQLILQDKEEYIKTELLKIKTNLIKIKNNKINNFRNNLQNEYINLINIEFEKFNKCFIQAPTGFGKTHIFYKLIVKNNYKKILFLTPRKILNSQLLDKKYLAKYIFTEGHIFSLKQRSEIMKCLIKQF